MKEKICMVKDKTTLSRGQIITALIMNLAIVVMATVGSVNNYNTDGWGWRMLIFYTCNSNIFGAIASAILVVFYIRMLRDGSVLPGWTVILKYMSVCCLTITCLVTVFVLTPVMAIDATLYGFEETATVGESIKFMLLGKVTLFHHVLTPLAAFLSFVWFERLPCGPKKSLLFALIPTTLYAVISITLNILRIWHGPYPFLYVYEQPLWMSFVWFIIVFGGASLISYLIAKIKNPIKG